MSCFNVDKFRTHFPLLNKKHDGRALVYFDNAATTQKPSSVLDMYQEYYSQYNANVHRASHHLSALSTSAFERSREVIQAFINAKYLEEIIWTKGTTDSLNLLSQSLGHLLIEEGDEIIVSQSEHHANIVPWQMLAQQKKAHINVAPLTDNGTIDIDALKQLITNKTKIVSCAHISNVIGKVNPVSAIVELCKNHNIISIIDGAQAIAHKMVDVQKLDCDFYLFSAHKIYGPTGVGVLYGKRELLNQMPPYQGGGEMIQIVSFSGTTYNKLPFKFEAGTPNIAGVIAFSASIDFLAQECMANIIEYEETLTDYCYKQLKTVSLLNFIYEGSPNIPVFSFTIEGQHNHDVASYLDANGIASRAGHHCAMPLMEYLGLAGCLRISLTAYNTVQEIDYLVSTLNTFISQIDTESIVTTHSIKSISGNETSEDLINTFTTLKSWDSRHREIMLMGKRHPRMNQVLKIESNVIQGCESKAWLSYTITNSKYHFSADSDAKIIRGLISIVLAAFNNKNNQEIQAFDIKNYFELLGLTQHLSPSRANGLNAIVDKIYSVAN